MSNGYKSRKAELVAIYRLEFYKKQKNWKLSRETRKKPEKAKKLLNQTYNVEKPETGSESVLNKAFLETGADKNISSTDQIDSLQMNSPSCKPEKDWSSPVKGQQDQSDPVKDPPPDPEPVPTKPKKMTIAERIRLLNSESSESKPERIYQLWSEAADVSPDSYPNSTENNEYGNQNIWLEPEKEPCAEEVQWPTTIWSNAQQIWPQSSRNWPEPVGWDLGYQGGRPRYADMLETERTMGYEKGYNEDMEACISGVQVLPEDICAEDLPLEWEKLATDEGLVAEDWLKKQELPGDQLLRMLLDQEQRCENTFESSAWSSFMRGANYAPHSSETELQVPSVSGSVVEESGGELGALSPLLPLPPLSSFSTLELQAHASRCARALREVLRETRSRTRVSQSSLFVEAGSLPRYSSGSDEPTRDVGLDGPPGGLTPLLRKGPPCSDVFLAGSHRNDPSVDLGDLVPQGRPDPPFLGRGRGRLYESSFHLSVGRGRGRPYVKI